MNKTIDGKNNVIIYIGVAVAYFVLLVIAYLYGDKLAGVRQSLVVVNYVFGIGVFAYLRKKEYALNFRAKIYEKKSLCIVCTLIFVMIIGNYYATDMAFSDNLITNIWFVIEAIAVAFGIETVVRGFSGYCFPSMGIKEEALVIFFGGVMCLPKYICAEGSGVKGILVAFVVSIAVSTMMTGFYLRYRKLGANIALGFILYYLAGVTKINSTQAESILGSGATIVIVIATIGMLAYGCAMLRTFNQSGEFDDSEYLKEDYEKNAEFREAFAQSKEKSKGKIDEKTAPAVEARRERYYERQEKRAEKRREKEQAKLGKENAKAKKL